MNRVLIFFLLSIIFTIKDVSAQNFKTKSIEWSSVSSFDYETGNRVYDTFTIISSQTNITISTSVDTRTFSVLKAVGDWLNVARVGKIEYQISEGEARGLVRFEKESGVYLIEVIVIRGDAVEHYSYEVNSFNVL